MAENSHSDAEQASSKLTHSIEAIISLDFAETTVPMERAADIVREEIDDARVYDISMGTYEEGNRWDVRVYFDTSRDDIEPDDISNCVEIEYFMDNDE